MLPLFFGFFTVKSFDLFTTGKRDEEPRIAKVSPALLKKSQR
jgi:hypothetical protein